MSTFSDVLRSNPDQRKAHFDSGMAYIRWVAMAEAAQQFQQELALYPGDPDAQYHLGFVYVSNRAWRSRAAL